MNRRFALVVCVLIGALLLWFVHSRIEIHRAEKQREAAYQDRLQYFQRELRLGASRSEVASYLHDHGIAYNLMSQNFDVKIGEEPGSSIFCGEWHVYIEMKFSRLRDQVGASPFDNLDGISIQKIGSCL